MKRTTKTKARISLIKRRKQVSLFVGRSTPVNLNPYLELSNFSIEHFKLFQFSANSDVSEHLFFTPTNGKGRKRCAMYDEALRSFVNECIEALKENTPTTAKELFNLTSYGEQKETVSMTFGEWLQRVIDLYHYNNPHANNKSNTWRTYDVVRRKCELWDNGAILQKKVCDVVNADFEAFGKWIEKDLRGANYRNLMKNFAAVMKRAIEASEETGCTKEHNKLDYSLATKKVIRCINGKPVEKCDKVCFTEEQINAICKFNADDLQIKDRNKCLLPVEKKQIYLDIIKFALHTGMRPIDLLRLRKDSVKPICKRMGVVYLPIKLDYVKTCTPQNKDVKDFYAIVPMYGDMQNIIDKYSTMSDSEFVFPIEANIKHNGRYETKNDYARYNHTQAQINSVLKSVAKAIGVNGTGITLYTCRHSVATKWAANPQISITTEAKMLGTSVKMLYTYYIHSGIEDLADLL